MWKVEVAQEAVGLQHTLERALPRTKTPEVRMSLPLVKGRNIYSLLRETFVLSVSPLSSWRLTQTESQLEDKASGKVRSFKTKHYKANLNSLAENFCEGGVLNSSWTDETNASIFTVIMSKSIGSWKNNRFRMNASLKKTFISADVLVFFVEDIILIVDRTP